MSALEPISMQAVSEKVVLARKGRLEEDAQFVENPRLTSTEFIPWKSVWPVKSRRLRPVLRS